MSECVKVYSEAIAKINNEYICMALENNLIYSVDKGTGNIKIGGMLPEEYFSSQRLCGDIKIWKNKLLFIPFMAEKLWIYDLDSLKWESVVLNNPHSKYKFYNSLVYKDYLFMIPSRYRAFVIVDLSNLAVVEMEDYLSMKLTDKEPLYGFFYSNYVVENGKIYLASAFSNEILIFDLETRKYEWKEIGNKENRYLGITKFNNDYWLAPRRNSSIVKWNEAGESVEYALPEGYDDKYNFMGIVGSKELRIFGNISGKTLLFDNGRFEKDKNNCEYSFADIIDGELITYTKSGQLTIEGNDYKTTFTTLIDKNELRRFFEKCNIKYSDLIGNDATRESEMFDISEFLNLVVASE